HDLSGCALYTTAYPCPMCLGATIWANIQTVVYGCRPEDADAIGFRDDFIYEYIRGETTNVQSVLATKEAFRDECLKLFKEYHDMDKEIY
ncbi:MAG: deaminase, partial [Bacillota bacterium]